MVGRRVWSSGENYFVYFDVIYDHVPPLQTNMTEAFNGEWICRILILGVTDRAFKESTNVTLLGNTIYNF